MKPEPVVHPADINPATDGRGQLVLALTLPGHVTKLFAGGLSSVAAACKVYKLPTGFFVGFVVLQARSHQVRVVIPLYDEKSFSWLGQCFLKSNVSCMFTDADTGASQQFDFSLNFSAVSVGVLHEMRRAPNVAAGDVLLVIASSVPSMAAPSAVESLSAAEVEAVSVCVVREFFNTKACKLAAAELLRRS